MFVIASLREKGEEPKNSQQKQQRWRSYMYPNGPPAKQKIAVQNQRKTEYKLVKTDL